MTIDVIQRYNFLDIKLILPTQLYSADPKFMLQQLFYLINIQKRDKQQESFFTKKILNDL